MKNYLIALAIFVIAAFAGIAYTSASESSAATTIESASGKEEAVLVKKGELNIEAKAKLLENTSGDYSMGNKYAPVLMIEYASLSCSHCANFHDKVLDDLIVSHINTGKLRYIFRDFPLNQPALDASLLARCADKNNYFNFVKVLFKSQENWAYSPDYKDILRNIAKLGGIEGDNFDECLADKAMQEEILTDKKDAIEVLEVNSTPTIFINGVLYKGPHLHKDVADYVDSLLSSSKN